LQPLPTSSGKQALDADHIRTVPSKKSFGQFSLNDSPGFGFFMRFLFILGSLLGPNSLYHPPAAYPRSATKTKPKSKRTKNDAVQFDRTLLFYGRERPPTVHVHTADANAVHATNSCTEARLLGTTAEGGSEDNSATENPSDPQGLQNLRRCPQAEFGTSPGWEQRQLAQQNNSAANTRRSLRR
jgi:hypothetical protein